MARSKKKTAAKKKPRPTPRTLPGMRSWAMEPAVPIAFDAGGRLLAVVDARNPARVFVFDADDGARREEYIVGGEEIAAMIAEDDEGFDGVEVAELAFSSDGARRAALVRYYSSNAGDHSTEVEVWRAGAGASERREPPSGALDGNVGGLALSGGGDRVAFLEARDSGSSSVYVGPLGSTGAFERRELSGARGSMALALAFGGGDRLYVLSTTSLGVLNVGAPLATLKPLAATAPPFRSAAGLVASANDGCIAVGRRGKGPLEAWVVEPDGASRSVAAPTSTSAPLAIDAARARVLWWRHGARLEDEPEQPSSLGGQADYAWVEVRWQSLGDGTMGPAARLPSYADDPRVGVGRPVATGDGARIAYASGDHVVVFDNPRG